MAIARDVAAKDPAALRATKDGYRFSLEMTWEASMNYTNAKEEELANSQRVSWKDEGVQDFVDRQVQAWSAKPRNNQALKTEITG